MDATQNTTQFITSKDNDFFKKIKSYALPKNRKRDEVILVEGKRSYREALQVLKLRHTLTNEEYRLDPSDDTPLEHHTKLSNHLFAALSDTKNSQGIIGIFDMPCQSLDLSLLNKVVVLEGIQDPGNVGTLIRTAFFLGYQAVLFDDTCAAPFSPKVVRSSMGAIFHLPCFTAPIEAHLSSVKDAGFCIAGGDLQGEDIQKCGAAAQQQRLALLLGNEGTGLSEVALSYCDYRLRIPEKNEEAESLNVAVAGGIMMYLLNE